MAQRPVNDAQRKVLDWLAAGGVQEPPMPEMKISAAALKSRGMVRIRRPGGKWAAELTEAGRYFVEHGAYPSQPGPRTDRAQTRRRETARRRPDAPSQNPVPQREPAAAVPAVEEVSLRQVIRRPHPAIKEIRDRPGRLPKFARRRCLLIAHALVTEALGRGWTVTPVTGRMERDPWGSRSVRYDSGSLLLIDAGHAPVGLIFDEVTKRQPHEDTKEEAAKRAEGEFLYAPAYDYVGTGRLRLHLTQHERKIQPNYTDTARVLLEDKLPAVLDAINGASLQALHWAEEPTGDRADTRGATLVHRVGSRLLDRIVFALAGSLRTSLTFGDRRGDCFTTHWARVYLRRDSRKPSASRSQTPLRNGSNPIPPQVFSSLARPRASSFGGILSSDTRPGSKRERLLRP